MAFNEVDRAQVLAEALPYIQKYSGKTIVVKYGGNAMISEDLRRAVISDIVLLNLVGIRVVVVHGGGPEINEMLTKIGKESKFVDGLRYTDEETMDIVQQVLCGKVNNNLVATLNRMGGKAIGLCGMDGNMIKCKPLDDSHGYVGEITEMNMEAVEEILNNHWIPVISTVGYDENGNCYNINADTVAAAVAGELNAEALVSMTDIVGLLRDKDDASTLIHKVFISDTPALIADGIISGGMIPKIDSMSQALRNGCKKAFIIDGRVPHSILMELLTDEGMGTMFRLR